MDSLVALTALLAASLMLAGCTATPGGEGGTPTLTPTPTPGECDAVEQHPVDPFREDVEPSEPPDPPGEWNRSSVERYVVAFEEAYSRNAALRNASTRVEVTVGDVSVQRSGDVWVVGLTSRTNTWAQGRATGTATATVVHGDGAHIPVTYRLTDRALYRTERSVGGPSSESPTATPGRGTPVACFDG